MRHVQTRYLWIQERVAAKDVHIVKVKGGDNVADIMTKITNRPLLWKHMTQMGYVVKQKSGLQKGLAK